MNQSAVSLSPQAPVLGNKTLLPLVALVWELDECHRAGVLSTEDFARLRAEKLGELTCPHRGLWLGPIIAAGSFASVVGAMVWLLSASWQATASAAGLAAVFGLAMLGRVCREKIRHSQIKDRRTILENLLLHDLLTVEEYMFYEDLMLAGD